MTAIYEPMIGEDVDRAIAKMLGMGGEVRATFNGADLIVRPGDTADAVRARWAAAMDANGEAYRRSPEGQRAAQKAIDRRVRLQAEMDQCVAELPDLQWEDPDAVLGWLDRFADPADHTEVTKPTATIIEAFTSHGFIPGENVGPAFDGEDRENCARYIIGQCLDGMLAIGAPHPVCRRFIADWCEKFGRGVDG